MNNISFENIACTQVRIDGELYELPYRINSVLDFPEILIFHSYPKSIDTQESQVKFDFEGKFSLYALSKKNKEVIWKLQNVVAVFHECVTGKQESDFITKEHYLRYIETFKGKSLLTVYIGEFRKLIDANTGEAYSSMESR